MKKIFLIFCFVSILTMSNAFSDTVILKNGRTVEGNILEKTDKLIKIKIEDVGIITYYLDEINEINGQKIQGQPKPSTNENTTAGLVPPTPSEDTNQALSPETEATEENVSDPKPYGSAPDSTRDLHAPKKDKSSWRAKMNTREAKLALGLFAGFFAFILIVGIIAYIYGAICLYFIAKKTAVEPAWFAWVPIANLFLMCDIAKVKHLWLLGLLTLLIPIINILGNFYAIGLFVYLWYKIALARNKPGWIGILTIIPIANFVAMGYLAFSD